jgi:1,4-dihydroxy-2-naphthoate octaprenyltransferase
MPDGFYKVKSTRLLIQLSRPVFILISALLYLLGGGIAWYLSGLIDWTPFILGLVWVVLILIGFQYLNEYFYQEDLEINFRWWHTPFSCSSGAIGKGKLSRQVALWAGLTCLSIAASITVLMLQNQILHLVSAVLLGVIFLVELLYSVPPIRLVTSGYGEITMSIIMAGMIPGLAYLLQGHEIHRLLIMVSFPLTILFLGMLLALEFPSYAFDINHGKKPILVRIGWQKGMLLHNILILSSFVILGIALLLGMPLRIGWPALFVIPIGLYQVWMMNRIADGIKPNWNMLTLIALSNFCLTTYLLTFSFWIH